MGQLFSTQTPQADAAKLDFSLMSTADASLVAGATTDLPQLSLMSTELPLDDTPFDAPEDNTPDNTPDNAMPSLMSTELPEDNSAMPSLMSTELPEDDSTMPSLMSTELPEDSTLESVKSIVSEGPMSTALSTNFSVDGEQSVLNNWSDVRRNVNKLEDAAPAISGGAPAPYDMMQAIYSRMTPEGKANALKQIYG